MTSFLAGSLAKQIAQAFKGVLLQGTIRRNNPTSRDQYGDVVVPSGDYTDYTFTGMRESFDASYRVRALIPETDVKILVLLSSIRPLENPPIIPTQADRIMINGDWHQIRKVLSIDPAGATQSLQCYILAS